MIASPPRLTSPRLIGRDAERDLVLRAAARPPGVVLLEGEAGVGKTRLVTEALAHPDLAGRRVLLAACHPMREPFPLGPVLESLRTADALPTNLSPVVGALRALLPEMASALPPAPPPLEDARAERHRVFRAVAELLTSLGPTVCVLEDAHWADETTLEFLRFLTAAQPPELTLLLTYRPEDLDRASPLAGMAGRLPTSTLGLRLTLTPLDSHEVGRLVAAILDTDEVSDEFAAYLHDRTAGLPFAVEEVLRLLQERRHLVRRDGRWARQVLDRLAVPAAVRDAIRERVARLEPDARAVVETLAVMGKAAHDDVLARASGHGVDAVRDALSVGLTSGLLSEQSDGTTQFRHTLAAQAVYDDLPGPHRRAVHLAVARALEEAPDEQQPVGQLAFHYGRGGDPRQAARYAEAAADLAAQLHDDVAVCRFLQQALASPDTDTTARVRMACRLGEAALHAFDHAEAASVLRQIIDGEPLAPAARGELRHRLAILLVQSGDASAGVAEMARAVAELTDRPVTLTQTLLGLAAPWVVEGTADEHRNWLARAEATDAGPRTPADQLVFLVDRATVLASLADPAGRDAEAAIPSDAATVEERRILQRGCLNLAQTALYTGAYDRAAQFLDRFATLAQTTPSALLEGLHRTTTVLLDWHMGRWTDLADRAEDLCRSMAGVPHAAIDVEAVAGLLSLARVVDPQPAVARLHPLLDTARRAGSIPVLAMAAGGLTSAYLALGRADAALAAGEPAMAVLRAKATWGWAADLAPPVVTALAAAGRGDDAAELTERFASEASTLDAPAAAAAVAVCRGVVARDQEDLDGAAHQFTVAAAAWAVLPRPYEAARAQVAAAGCLLDLGRPHAQDAADAALEALRSLDADGEGTRARKQLRDHGAKLPYRWRGGRRGYGQELSPRETDVVARVAQGMTNREVAEELFLSVRTVEFHVAKAMRKLGVSNRRELSDRLLTKEEAR